MLAPLTLTPQQSAEAGLVVVELEQVWEHLSRSPDLSAEFGLHVLLDDIKRHVRSALASARNYHEACVSIRLEEAKTKPFRR